MDAKAKRVIHNILSNLAAILWFAKTVYPNMSAETIMASVQDGSIFGHVLNLIIIYFLYNYEGPHRTDYSLGPKDTP